MHPTGTLHGGSLCGLQVHRRRGEASRAIPLSLRDGPGHVAARIAEVLLRTFSRMDERDPSPPLHAPEQIRLQVMPALRMPSDAPALSPRLLNVVEEADGLPLCLVLERGNYSLADRLSARHPNPMEQRAILYSVCRLSSSMPVCTLSLMA